MRDASSGACVIALLSGAGAFTQRLDERGLSHRSLGVDPLLLGMAGASPELCRLEVELVEGMQPSDLYRLACEAGAVVLETPRRAGQSPLRDSVRFGMGRTLALFVLLGGCGEDRSRRWPTRSNRRRAGRRRAERAWAKPA